MCADNPELRGMLSQLTLGTTIIIAEFADKPKESATGFFYQFENSENGQVKSWELLLITNRHVVENADSINIVFHLCERGSEYELIGSVPCHIDDVEQSCIWHRDPDVDLCAIRLRDHVRRLEYTYDRLAIRPFGKNSIRDDLSLSYLGAINDIYMVGYPDGFFDTQKKFPIFRKGATASPPFLDFINKKLQDDGGANSVFLIDLPVFKGSSGSPILLYKENEYTDGPDFEKRKGGKMLLIGIAARTYRIQNAPEVFMRDPLDRDNKGFRLLHMPSDLGIAVRAKEIKALEI